MALFSLVFKERELDFNADCTLHPLVSIPHTLSLLLPANLASLTTTTFIACLPPPCAHPTTVPRRFLPATICLSFEMKRKCLPVGSQVAHPEGWLRLMPAIQLC